MNIFFTASVRGVRAHKPKHEFIVHTLEKYGSTYSPLAYFDTLSEYGETELSRKEIHAREEDALTKSDVVVAEVTTPSLGVGYLIGSAVALKKRVVALYDGEDSLKLSAMIKGAPGVEVHTYTTNDDIEQILQNVLGTE
jgi:2'-deoxynucleoside 5'-phosphate N-hydrolase